MASLLYGKLHLKFVHPMIDFKDDLVAKGHKLENAPILDPIVLQASIS